jgi:hypothetical protein
MAAIRLRSPRYRATDCSATHLSVKMVINISGSDVYTIIKDSVANQKNLFEYAELCRDYISINWTGSYSGWSPQAGIAIRTTITYHAGANGTGNTVSQGVTGGGTVTQYGFDSYSDYVEGANKDIMDEDLTISNYTQTTGGAKTYTIYVPKNTSGNIPYMNSNADAIVYVAFATNATSVTVSADTVNIVRYHCNKYDVIPIDFVNKFGAIQREYFTLKSVENVKASRENFKRNIVTSSGTYSVNKHNIQNFNIVANEELTVNSDYLPEYYNEVFTELLLSNQVWAYIKSFSTNSFTAIPINITDSNLTYKTQVNDRLINFKFSFKKSFDKIQNVR